jgi:RNA polymerase sigma-70 factor (ECF subfamily)
VGAVSGRGMTAPQPPSDEDLFRRLTFGDEEAFTALYRRWQGPIFRFGLRMSGSPAVAEDVAQEVFMALVTGSGRYDPNRGSLPSYLFGMARNQVRRRFEKERPYVAIPQGNEEPAVTAEDLLEDLARSERVQRVREAVLALPPHYREVVVLFDLQLLSYQETADALGCAVGTVRSRLHRARALLLARLGDRDAPPLHGAEARAGGMP